VHVTSAFLNSMPVCERTAFRDTVVALIVPSDPAIAINVCAALMLV
jgi:hypothetical protein